MLVGSARDRCCARNGTSATHFTQGSTRTLGYLTRVQNADYALPAVVADAASDARVRAVLRCSLTSIGRHSGALFGA